PVFSAFSKQSESESGVLACETMADSLVIEPDSDCEDVESRAATLETLEKLVDGVVVNDVESKHTPGKSLDSSRSGLSSVRRRSGRTGLVPRECFFGRRNIGRAVFAGATCFRHRHFQTT